MPPAKDPDVLNRLKQVYGAMPPKLTPEYKKTDQYIKQLKVRDKTGRDSLAVLSGVAAISRSCRG